MPTFAFVAVDYCGKRVSGEEIASNAETARVSLQRRGLLVLAAREAHVKAASARRTLQAHETLALTRSLAALLDAGMPLTAALTHTAQVVPSCAWLIDFIRTRVEKGAALAPTLNVHPRIFSGVYVGVIAAGERSGDLGGAFRRMVAHLESQAALRARLTSAAIYPALLAVASVLATAFLVAYVIPRFASVLTDTGLPLPRSTALLIGASTLLQQWWPLLLASAALGSSAVVISTKHRATRVMLARALLRAPFIGALRRELLAARFGALVSVMLKGGVPLLNALTEAARCIGDPIARNDLENVRTRVQSGASLHTALTDTTSFASVLVQLAAVGENSSRLADFLGRAAAVCTENTERSLLRLVTFAEPAMILGFGLVVGFVAVALLQAVYSVNGSVVP